MKSSSDEARALQRLDPECLGIDVARKLDYEDVLERLAYVLVTSVGGVCLSTCAWINSWGQVSAGLCVSPVTLGPPSPLTTPNSRRLAGGSEDRWIDFVYMNHTD